MLENLTIKQFHNGIIEKKFSVAEIISESLERIEKENGGLHAFLSVFSDEAKKKARELDAADISEKKSPLFGAPLAIKDNILIQGTRMTAASKILENYISSYDATVIKKLREHHVVFVGKTNLDEFAMGSSTENSAFGLTKNPHDDARVPGGSSGGSAAAVAAHMALGALGSDTGGSIRQPASFCGVVGLKPTYGSVSRYGAVALASSLDQIGPFAKTVEDASYIFDAITGHDPDDATSESRRASSKKMVIGVPKEYFANGMDATVEKEVMFALDAFKKNGFEIKEISLPHTKYALSCYYIIMPAEASANLGRYDGIRYGIRDKGRSLFGEEAIRRILLGTFVLSSGYYDAYYAKAQKVRRKILDDFTEAFKSVDVIFTPVVPTTAFKIGEKAGDPLSMYLSDIFTIPANLAGLPAVSIPVRAASEHGKNSLPVNFQLIGKHFHESDLFDAGIRYELIRDQVAGL